MIKNERYFIDYVQICFVNRPIQYSNSAHNLFFFSYFVYVYFNLKVILHSHKI